MTSTDNPVVSSNDDLSSDSTTKADESSTAISGDQLSTSTSHQRPVIQNISQRTIPGVLSEYNQKAIDWSVNGLIAFASHNRVIIVDALHGLKHCQSLHRHNSSVCLIRWCPTSDFKLCSVDTNGTIIIWDVIEGSFLTLIAANKDLKGIQSVEWISLKTNLESGFQQYLLVLSRNNNLVLLDTEFGEIVWTKHYDLIVKSISLDPFCKNNVLLAIQSTDCCFAIFDDLRSNGCPNRLMKYYSVSSNNSPKTPSKSSIQSKYNLLLDQKVINDSNILNEWIEICYHKSVRNQVLVAISRQIFIIDLSIESIICLIPLERNCSNITNIFSCQYRNAFFLCHDFGTVSLRLFQKQMIKESNGMTDNIVISYANLCQSDGLRLTKQNKIFGSCMSPMDETKVALLLSNGRVVIKKIHKMGTKPSNGLLNLQYIYDIISSEQYIVKQNNKCKKYRILMTQISSAINFNPNVIRMCPPVTMRNWQFHRPFLAVGDMSGSIQIWNLSLSTLEREFSLHSFPVRGIEWTGLDAFISYAFPNISPHSGKTNNELNITEMTSGTTYPMRAERNLDSSPIESLRISHLKQYLIISFKEDPFEIWDLKSLQLLRVMPKQFSSVTAIEWSPLYSRRLEANDTNNVILHSRENFVITNTNGELYHFSVEGNIVKEITCIPPDTDMSANITCIAWKSDQVLLGDAIGNLNIWDLKRKASRIETTHRGNVRKIRFGPGRGNMKFLILYNDGIDIWDTKDFKLTAQLKYPRDVSYKIVDIDWAASDRPILCTSEGTILVTDMKLRQYSCPMTESIVNQTDSDQIDLNCVNFFILSQMSRFILKSKLILNQINTKSKLFDCDVERNIFISKLFNDCQSFNFWNTVSYVLFDNKERLDRNNDIFLDNKQFKEILLEKVSILDSIRTKHKQNLLLYELFVILNHSQRAVQLLLESDSSIDDYYVDALKACLIAALQSTNDDSTAHPVIKLVATNLIANGRIDDGSQMLCLIGKTQDACRYLQSANKWMESIFLAKCTLNGEEYNEIMRRWAEHLISHNDYQTAVIVYITIKQYLKAIQILYKFDIEKAFIFSVVCLKRQLINIDDNKQILDDIFNIYSKSLENSGLDQLLANYKNLFCIPLNN